VRERYTQLIGRLIGKVKKEFKEEKASGIKTDMNTVSNGRNTGKGCNYLYGEAPSERGTFFRPQVYKRVGQIGHLLAPYG